MNYDLKDLRFHVDENGKADEVVPLLNCLNGSFYLLLKNNPDYQELKKDLHYFFLDDLTFSLMLDPAGEFMNLSLNTIGINKKFIKISENEVRESSSEAMLLVESLLNMNVGIIIRTVSQKLNFLTFYLPGFCIGKRRPTHGFLIVGQDDMNFFYVENAQKIKKDHKKTHISNESVYIARKEDFMEAFEQCLICHTVKIDFQNIISLNKMLKKILEGSIESYYFGKHEIQLEEGSICVGGREAILKLIDLCENEKLILTDKVFPHYIQTLKEHIWIKIGDICNRKKLLEMSLKNFGEDSIVLVEKLLNSIKSWTLLKNNIERNFLKKEYFFNLEYKNQLLYVLESEDIFFKSVIEFLNSKLIISDSEFVPTTIQSKS